MKRVFSQSPLSRLFSVLLLSFFVLQLVIGIIVIVYIIGGEMTRMKVEEVESELHTYSNSMTGYLEDRLLLLGDYARLPVVVSAVMHPMAGVAEIADFMDALTLLREKALFSLQGYDGTVIITTGELSGKNLLSGPRLADVMENGKVQDIAVVMTVSGVKLWRLSVPVRYLGNVEGVFSAFVPIDLLPVFDAKERGGVARLRLYDHGKLIVERGAATEPFINASENVGPEGLRLELSVSKSRITERVEYLVVGMSSALFVGTVLLMGIIHFTGRRFFIVPHERLRAMSDGLEKEVALRTAVLKTRTEQLGREVTERRDAERAAREGSQLVDSLLEGIEAAFLVVRPEDRVVVQANSVVYRMFGLQKEDVVGQKCLNVFNGPNEENGAEGCPLGIESQSYTEGVAHSRDGRVFPVAQYLVPVLVRGEPHVGIMLLDITDRKNLERRLSIAQKLESIGELATGVAHEINTPIQFVGDSVQFLDEIFEDVVRLLQGQRQFVEKCLEVGVLTDEAKAMLTLMDELDVDFVAKHAPKACKRAIEGTERVASIVRAMKNFAHPGTGEKQDADINACLENTITVAKNEWKYVAEVVTDFGDLPPVRCLAGDMNQVFLNMIVNAAHAIADVVKDSGTKGEIRISTGQEEGDAVIRFEDTGAGIPGELIDKIYDPFFTTKEVGRGTGQGLAIVHDIVVNRHGGSVDVHSVVGTGTTFTIRIPVG